jgi:hypothetical protein
MKSEPYSTLQLREVFHLEFLRWLGRGIKAGNYALKGGVNMRFFFTSCRYSDDMDLDAAGISVERLRIAIMKILHSASFQEVFVSFGIREIVPPDMKKATQTGTTQRFKVHLVTAQGTDFLTKIEFSRRRFNRGAIVEAVPNTILRKYKLPPLIVPHYNIISQISQKIHALTTRAVSQARDVFDLYLLSTQYDPAASGELGIRDAEFKSAVAYVYDMSFTRFRDTVLAYLSIEDRALYDSAARWDEIRLKVVTFIEEFNEGNG